MEWLRQVSLVKRVMIGFVAMGVIVLVMGAAAGPLKGSSPALLIATRGGSSRMRTPAFSRRSFV